MGNGNKIICTYCKAETRADQLFCSHCGAPILVAVEVEEPEPDEIKPRKKRKPFPRELGPPLGFSVAGIAACWAPVLGGIPSFAALILSLWTLVRMPRKIFSILALFLSVAGIVLNVYFTLRFFK